MGSVKLCKDCKHYKWNKREGGNEECRHPNYINLVNGKKGVRCSTARYSTALEDCGRSANFFEEKAKNKNKEIDLAQEVEESHEV